MLYGEPQLEIVSDDTDIVGLRTLMVGLAWAVPHWPMTIPEYDAATPAVPEVGGGLMLVGRRTRHNGGAMNTAWVFTGINGSGKDVTFRDRSNSIDKKFEPGFSQVDIGLHPRIQQLLDAYQGTAIDGEIYFPPKITVNGKEERSPVALYKDFLRMEGTYSYRYMSFSLSGVQNNEGHIVDIGALPGHPDITLSDGRNFLVAPTIWQQHGPVYEIVEQFWLSGPGGWPVAVYGRLNDGGGRGLDLAGAGVLDALTSGTLSGFSYGDGQPSFVFGGRGQ